MSRFQRDVPDEKATHERWERVRQSCIHRCVEGEEQRAEQTTSGVKSVVGMLSWLVQQPGDRVMIFTHETVKDVTKLQQLEQAATEAVGRKEKSITSNVQCKPAVKRVPEGQRGDATIPMWQPSSRYLFVNYFCETR